MQFHDFMAVFEIRQNMEAEKFLPDKMHAELSRALIDVIYDPETRVSERDESLRLLYFLLNHVNHNHPVVPGTIELLPGSYRVVGDSDGLSSPVTFAQGNTV